MTVDEKEEAALRLLLEAARERGAPAGSLVRAEVRGPGGTLLAILDERLTGPAASAASLPSAQSVAL